MHLRLIAPIIRSVHPFLRGYLKLIQTPYHPELAQKCSPSIQLISHVVEVPHQFSLPHRLYILMVNKIAKESIFPT